MELKQDKTLGYLYFMDHSHPLSNGQGKVYYHRHVAMQKLGRPLLEDEHVHHIDGNRMNNHPDNLEIVSPSEHAKLHNQPQEKVLYPCLVCNTPSINPFCCSRKCKGIYQRTKKHGTFSMYARHKCRCEICKEYARNKSRKFRLSKKVISKTKTPSTHGTPSMYKHHGCRCDDCRNANNLYSKSQRDRKRKNKFSPRKNTLNT